MKKGVINLGILFLMIILASGFVIAYTSTCSDSDGGKVFTTKGIVSGKTIYGTTYYYSDKCSNNTLNEFYCQNSSYKSMSYSCSSIGKVCSNGACVTLTPTCTPKTCSSLGKTCGIWSDGCGKNITCGTCASGTSCSSSGSCVAETLTHVALDPNGVISISGFTGSYSSYFKCEGTGIVKMCEVILDMDTITTSGGTDEINIYVFANSTVYGSGVERIWIDVYNGSVWTSCGYFDPKEGAPQWGSCTVGTLMWDQNSINNLRIKLSTASVVPGKPGFIYTMYAELELPDSGEECTPNCAGKYCGSDGCGGSCGTCSSGYECIQNKYCAESDSDGLDKVPVESVCSDSDGGFSILTLGTISGLDSSGIYKIISDKCITSRILVEEYCSLGKITSTEINCVDNGFKGCQVGKCTNTLDGSLRTMSLFSEFINSFKKLFNIN